MLDIKQSLSRMGDDSRFAMGTQHLASSNRNRGWVMIHNSRFAMATARNEFIYLSVLGAIEYRI